MGDREEPRLARREQLLQGEFGAGVEVEARGPPVVADGGGGEGVEMRLVAGGGLEGGGVGLREAVRVEPGAQPREEAVAGEEKRAARLVARGGPPGVGRAGMSGGFGGGMR